MNATRTGGAAAVAILSLLATGCAASGTSPGSAQEQQGSRFDMLQQWELEAIPSHSALQAIQQRRPRWLRGRGPMIGVASSGEELVLVTEPGEDRVKVYVDGIRRDLDMLDMMPVRNVELMRFMSASEASVRFGIGHDAGAILVTTLHR